MVEARVDTGFVKLKKTHAHKKRQNPFGLLSYQLDRLTYRDSQEFLEKPNLPFSLRYRVVEKLSRLNDRSGYHSIFISQLERLIRELPGRRDGQALKILDIGAGGGGLLRAIYRWSRKKNIPVELTGVDASHEFVVTTQFNLRKNGVPVEMHYGDGSTLKDYEDNSFDIVVSSYVVHHIRTPGRVALFLSEVQRIAKGGWVIADFDRRFSGLPIVGAVGFLLSYSWILVADGIKSLRRAYRAYEINFILDEMHKINPELEMECSAYPFLPYWIIRGKKKRDESNR